MSSYANTSEVAEVIRSTLQKDGLNPAHYYIGRIAREAFYYRGHGYGYGANDKATWTRAVATHRRASAPPLPARPVPSHPNITVTRLSADQVPGHLDDEDAAEISAGKKWAVTVGLVHAGSGAVLYTSDPDACYIGEPGCAGTYTDPRAVPGVLADYAADVWTDFIGPYDREFIAPHGARVLVTDFETTDDERASTGFVIAAVRFGPDSYGCGQRYHLTELHDEEAR